MISNAERQVPNQTVSLALNKYTQKTTARLRGNFLLGCFSYHRTQPPVNRQKDAQVGSRRANELITWHRRRAEENPSGTGTQEVQRKSLTRDFVAFRRPDERTEVARVDWSINALSQAKPPWHRGQSRVHFATRSLSARKSRGKKESPSCVMASLHQWKSPDVQPSRLVRDPVVRAIFCSKRPITERSTIFRDRPLLPARPRGGGAFSDLALIFFYGLGIP